MRILARVVNRTQSHRFQGSSEGVAGKGFTRNRGRISNEEMDTSTNNARELEHLERGEVPTRIANHEPDAP